MECADVAKGWREMSNRKRLRVLDAEGCNSGLAIDKVRNVRKCVITGSMRKSIAVMGLKDMKALIAEAIELTYRNDGYLFDNNLGEWAVAFQFAYYLRTLCGGRLGEYSLDAKYDKAKLGANHSQKYTGWKNWNRPDVIIHKRGGDSSEDPTANILWVEIKRKKGARLDNDLKKLEVVTRNVDEEIKNVAGYKFGLSLLLPKSKDEVEIRWYMGGKEVK